MTCCVSLSCAVQHGTLRPCGDLFTARPEAAARSRFLAAMKIGEPATENTGVNGLSLFSCKVVSRRLMQSSLGMTVILSGAKNLLFFAHDEEPGH